MSRLSGAQAIAFMVMAAAVVLAPTVFYPVFLMRVLCFALFACAYNLLIGYVGLMSFRPRRLFRHGLLRCGALHREGLGFHGLRVGDSRGGVTGGALTVRRFLLARRSGGRASHFCHDHPWPSPR